MTVQDIRTILLPNLSKTTVATYLLHAREAILNCWPLPTGRNDDARWKQAKVHPDYHIDVLHSFYSVPHCTA